MLDTALNLTARLKQPLAPFETPLAPWFEELIEPIYDYGERVAQDHTSRYLELLVQLYSHDDAAQVIAWLEAQRAQQLSLRLAVRMLETREDVTPCPLGQAVACFRMGMVGLMQSYIAFSENDSFYLQDHSHREPTLLRQLFKMANESTIYKRDQCVETAKQQFKVFEKTWEDTVEAFTKIKDYCR
jgi:hypothetical protein